MKHIKSIIVGTLVLSMVAGCSSPKKLTEETFDVNFTMPSVTTQETEEPKPLTFETMYGDQLNSFLNHHYVFEGKDIPTYETNFYFIDAFIELSNYAQMGYFPITYQGYLDLSADFADDEFKTYGAYFVNYSERTLERIYILNKMAADNDITLTDETKANIDGVVLDTKNTAAELTGKSVDAMTSEEFDEWLALYYGPGMNEANLRDVLERFYMADAYTKYYSDNYNFADTVKNVPNINYALYYAPDTAEKAVKEVAKEKADKLLNSCKSVDDILTLATQDEDIFNYGEIHTIRGDAVEEFENWAYQEHQVGDMEVVYSKEYGYFVLGYTGTVELDEEDLTLIAIKDLNNAILSDIKNGKYEFYTNEAYFPANPLPTPTPVVATPEDIYNDMYETYLDQ